MSCSIITSKAVTTAPTCSQRRFDHDSIVRHTEAMGCEFVFGRDPIAFTVNNLSAKVKVENLAREVKNGRVNANGLAQQNLQDHEQGRTKFERRCIQSDSCRSEWRLHEF